MLVAAWGLSFELELFAEHRSPLLLLVAGKDGEHFRVDFLSHRFHALWIHSARSTLPAGSARTALPARTALATRTSRSSEATLATRSTLWRTAEAALSARSTLSARTSRSALAAATTLRSGELTNLLTLIVAQVELLRNVVSVHGASAFQLKGEFAVAGVLPIVQDFLDLGILLGSHLLVHATRSARTTLATRAALTTRTSRATEAALSARSALWGTARATLAAGSTRTATEGLSNLLDLGLRELEFLLHIAAHQNAGAALHHAAAHSGATLAARSALAEASASLSALSLLGSAVREPLCHRCRANGHQRCNDDQISKLEVFHVSLMNQSRGHL